ncbi:MAG: 4-hydroxy-tetrahydrodipicolinate reductase [Magnetococcales bacterium]|nr:4-hydroxy-tetrahydrodipicolinate reductase [Magnetococcales bacterium]
MSEPLLGIGLFGVGGRMGRMLAQAVLVQEGCRLTGGCDHAASGVIGRDLGDLCGVPPLGVTVCENPDQLFTQSDVIIDFSIPEATLRNLDRSRSFKKPLVIGTTGLDAPGREAVTALSREVAVVMSPNFSIGVNLLFQLSQQVAKTLGEEFDIEIIEAHHRHKVDSPSGTALRLGEGIAKALGRDLSRDAVYGRQGAVGARPRSTIGFATIRGGDVVGDHTVLFAGEGERIELTHKASSRMSFAKGAVMAAKWVVGRPPGLYDMGHILGLQ